MPIRNQPTLRRLILASGCLLPFLLALLLFRQYGMRDNPTSAARAQPPVVPLDLPAALAVWPWPQTKQDRPYRGLTHYLAKSPEGTTADLFDFDFDANPHLRLEIYDQDEDDTTPWDNSVRYWPNGVGQVTRHLNASGRGPVVAAWNGLFFDLNGQGSDGIAHHLTPVVLNGKLYFPDLDTYRWTFGVQYAQGRPHFKTLHMPAAGVLTQEFDYAAGAAQCLIREGAPLKLEPFPKPGEPIPPSHGSTPEEVGYIRYVDHIKTSRASLGWSKDNRHLYLLFVKAPTTETESALALKHDTPIAGGWTVADLQRFWQARKVWGAINSDGGGPAQLTYRQPDGNYLLLPPRWAAANTRDTLPPTFPNAPAGGALMYFYVRAGK
jgi:hypothetical protein